MTLSCKIKVPLPKNGITVRHSGNYHYVYKVTKVYRNIRGHPTSDRICIGKFDEATGMLVPNDRYWEFYAEDAVEILPSFNSIRSIGATYLTGEILTFLGITDILSSCLGKERSCLVLTAAIYMACKGNVMEHILGWCEGHTLTEAPLSSQAASVLFASITHDERMAFFRAWAAAKTTEEYLAYDVTSFSSYARGIADTEWGYNRDGDRLPQINLGCYLGQSSGLPVFYVTYPGSIVDKSHLRYMMAYNKDIGIEGVTFVMDKGFCSTANVRYMHSGQLPYIMGVEGRHKATKASIDKVRETIVSMRNRIAAGVYAQDIKGFYYGEQSTLHIYNDPASAERQRADLYRTVEAQEEKLSQLEQITKKDSKSYSAFFDINRKDTGEFTFERNYRRIDDAAKYAGFFCLLSSTGLSSSEVLEVYRRKDMIEKGFDDLKNHIDMKRLHTHTSATTDGKLFCAFIALIAISQMSACLGSFMSEKSMDKDEVIAELEKIRVVFASGDRRLMNPATKTQKSILKAFGLNEESLKSYISSSLA